MAEKEEALQLFDSLTDKERQLFIEVVLVVIPDNSTKDTDVIETSHMDSDL